MRPEAAYSRARARSSMPAAAARPTWTAPTSRRLASRPPAPAPESRTARTSKPESPASDPTPIRSAYIETPHHRTSRSSRGPPLASQTTDARDIEALEMPSRGRSQALFYNWDRQHEALNGSTPIDRVCERASKTPLHGEVSDAYEPVRERIQIRDHAVEIALRSLKPCL
jgi:hypothetical protein